MIFLFAVPVLPAGNTPPEAFTFFLFETFCLCWRLAIPVRNALFAPKIQLLLLKNASNFERSEGFSTVFRVIVASRQQQAAALNATENASLLEENYVILPTFVQTKRLHPND